MIRHVVLDRPYIERVGADGLPISIDVPDVIINAECSISFSTLTMSSLYVARKTRFWLL